LQGGCVPFWQTTVVPSLGGTTTVVFFAGGGGLLLLMQPPKRKAAIIALATIFIADSCSSTTDAVWICRDVGDRGEARM
jgi:hypothetical protein